MTLDRTIDGGYHGLYPRGVQVEVLPHQRVIAIVSVMQFLAISTSCVRLIHRTYIRKLWWDDFWAAVAFVCDLALFIVFLLLTTSSSPGIGTLRNMSIFSRWMTLLTYTTTLWTSRLTISVTITRLLPEGRERRLSKAVSIIFGLFLATLFLQKVFLCGTTWLKQSQCSIPQYTAIIELVTDNLADLWLLLAPAHMLWRMKLRRAHHRLIAAIFACGVFTMLASITHSTFILLNSQSWVGISGQIQAAIALVVANLLVVVTAVYRVLRRRACAADETPVPRRSIASSSSSGGGGDMNASGRRTDATSAAPHTTSEDTSHISLTVFSVSRLGSTIASGVPLSSFSYPPTLDSGEAQQGRESAEHSTARSEA